MNNNVIILKVKQRLNKLDSQDYDNLEVWQIVEAFNKAQLMWCRRQIHGYNIFKEGDEGSKMRIDDLQVLLTERQLKMNNKGIYVDSPLPDNYFQFKRVTTEAISSKCSNSHGMVVYLAEEANVDELLRDVNRNPNFAWGETFCTLINNNIRIYTDNKFDISKAKLVYYRMPLYIEVKGYKNPYTKTTSTKDVECEFKDDVIELLIDETCKILAGDIENINQQSIASSTVENNN